MPKQTILYSNLFLLTFLLLLPSIAYPAYDTLWTKTYGTSIEEQGRDIRADASGELLIVGYTGNPYSDSDIWVLRTDSMGDTLWTVIYQIPAAQTGYCIQPTADNGFIVTGTSIIDPLYDNRAFVLRADQNGDMLWTRSPTWNMCTRAYHVILTSDGGYLVTGFTALEPNTNDSIYTIKLDSDGNTVWEKTFGFYDDGTELRSHSLCVVEDADGNYGISGWAGEMYSSFDFTPILLRINQNGDSLMTRIYDFFDPGSGKYISRSLDGGYLIGIAADAAGGFICTNLSGDTIWTQTAAGSIYGIDTTDHSTYIVCGESNYDYLVSEVSAAGTALWSNIYGTTDDEAIAHACRQTPDGGYAVIGYRRPNLASDYDIYLMKLADLQEYICGDANGDLTVNVSDAVAIINYVFVGGNPPDPIEAGDCNCDGACNVSDAVAVINYVFVGGNDPCDTNGDDVPDC